MSEGLINGLMIAQIVVAAVMIVFILLQNRAEGLGQMFGGGGGEFFRTRRGLEGFLYYATMVLITAFAALSLIIVKFSS